MKAQSREKSAALLVPEGLDQFHRPRKIRSLVRHGDPIRRAVVSILVEKVVILLVRRERKTTCECYRFGCSHHLGIGVSLRKSCAQC